MKKLLSKMQKKVVSGALAFSMMFSFCYNAFPKSVFEHEHVHAHAEETDTINYVSLGDSMTNGYGFEGYRQGNYAAGDKFPDGPGVYGEGSYALQFAEWLEEETGKEVNHAQMASSACRAEDLLYLLGGRERPTDGWFTQVLNYTGAANREDEGRLQIVDGEDALKQLYVENITNADIISLAVGNASFGAYLMQYITNALGVFGATLPENEVVTFKDALVVLEDAEAEEYVMKAYDKAMAEFYAMIPAELAESEEIAMMKDVMSYIVAGFLLNYKGVIEEIVELNPDVEIILVGLMNTMSGMKLTDENGEVILNVGDTLDKMFGILNAYVETLPAVLKLAKKTADVEFYYVENMNINFIAQEFATLAENGWNAIEYKDEEGNVYGKLSGDVVRDRTIDAYNNNIAGMIGAGFGMKLPTITLTDVQAFEAGNTDWSMAVPKLVYEDGKYIVVLDETFNPEYYNIFYPSVAADVKNLTIAIYLGIEDAIAASMGAFDIPVDALMNIADMEKMAGVLTGFTPNLEPSVMLSDTEFGVVIPGMGYIPGASVTMDGVNYPFKGYDLPYYGEEGIDKPVDVRNDLGEHFTSTETLQAMCLIFGMFKVGNGMSVHPTPKTHYDIFNKMVETYTAGYTTNDSLEDKAEAFVEELEALAKEYGPEVAEKARELIKKYGPEVVKQLPNWIKEYGPTVLEFVEKYGPVVVAQLAPFVKEYGPIVASKAYEYAENAGYVAYVDELMAKTQSELAKARAQLVELREMIIAGAYEVNNKVVNGAKDFVAPMAYVGARNTASAVAMRASVVPCQTVIEQAQDVVNDAVTAVENQINAQVQDLLAVVDAKLAELDAMIAESVNTAIEMVVDVVVGVQEMVEEGVKKANAYVEETIAKVEARVNEFIAEVEAFVEELVEEINETIAVIEANVQRLVEEAQQKYLELVAAIEEVKATVERTVEFINMLSDLTFVSIRDTYEGAFVTDYEYLSTVEKTLNYLALGDATVAGYADAVANLWSGWTVNKDTNANAGTIAKLEESLMDAAFVAQIENADIISVNFSNTAILEFVKYQIFAEVFPNVYPPVELDWAKVVGEENVAYVAQLLDTARVYLETQVGSEPIEIMPGFSVAPAEIAMVAIENYAYSYVELNVNYMQAINSITAINPTAKVLMVGLYNPFKGLVVEGINVGEYFDYLVNVMGVEYSIYAMTSDNFAFVDVTEVEMVGGFTSADSIADVLVKILDSEAFLVPTADGYAYMAEQIAAAVNFVEVEHVHEYEAVVTDPTCTEDGYTTYTCKDCGHEYVGDKVEAVGRHSYDNAPYEYDENGHWKNCTVCGEKGQVKEHNYNKTHFDKNGHWKECACGVDHKERAEDHRLETKTDGDDHWKECSRCDYETTKQAHVYDREVVDDKYFVSGATCEEEAVYYKSCKCGKAGTETFKSGDALGHTYGDWVSNGDGTHTKTCGRDNTHKVTENCSGGTPTCTDKAVCTECNAEYGDASGHDYSMTYSYDENSHWFECSCGHKKNVANHNFVAGQEVDGVVTYTCQCGKTKLHGHSYSVNYDENNHWMECSCGKIKDVCAHEFDDGVEANGKITCSCNCGYSYYVDVEPVSTGAIIAVAASSLVVAGGGGFTLVWFGIYKKSAADLVAAVKNIFGKFKNLFVKKK